MRNPKVKFLSLITIVGLLVFSCSDTSVTSVERDAELNKVKASENILSQIAQNGIAIIPKKESDLFTGYQSTSILNVRSKVTDCINRTFFPVFNDRITYRTCSSTDSIQVYGLPYKRVEYTQRIIDDIDVYSLELHVETTRTAPTFANLQSQSFFGSLQLDSSPFVAIYPFSDTLTFRNETDFIANFSGDNNSDTIIKIVTY